MPALAPKKENEMNTLSLILGLACNFGSGIAFGRYRESGSPKTLPLAVALGLLGIILIAAA